MGESEKKEMKGGKEASSIEGKAKTMERVGKCSEKLASFPPFISEKQTRV